MSIAIIVDNALPKAEAHLLDALPREERLACACALATRFFSEKKPLAALYWIDTAFECVNREDTDAIGMIVEACLTGIKTPPPMTGHLSAATKEALRLCRYFEEVESTTASLQNFFTEKENVYAAH